MSWLSRRRLERRCFYCSHVTEHGNESVYSFTCASCQQPNRYDKNGDIQDVYAPLTDITRLKYRAKPRTITTANPSTPLCNTCITNQTLIHTLITNNQDDYSGDGELNQYAHALEKRYPPLCNTCEHAVNDLIMSRDYRAKSRALGEWLKRSVSEQGVELDAQNTTTNSITSIGPAGKYSHSLWVARGVAWLLHNATAFLIHYSRYKRNTSILSTWYTLTIPLSLLYAFWDPSWSTAMDRRRRSNGIVSVSGRKLWIAVQMAIWIERSVVLLWMVWSGSESYRDSNSGGDSTSTLTHAHALGQIHIALLIAEVLAQFVAYCKLQVLSMRQINLSNSRSSRGGEGVVSDSKLNQKKQRDILNHNNKSDSDTLDLTADSLQYALSLDNTASKKLPIFGQASLAPSEMKQRQTNVEQKEQSAMVDSDEMEWVPEKAVNNVTESHTTPSTYLQPQRFFAPQDKQRTGLEGALGSVSLGEGGARCGEVVKRRRDWSVIVVSIVVSLIALLVSLYFYQKYNF